MIHSNFPYVQIASKTLSEEFITSSISSGSKHELTVLFPTCRKKWFAVCRLAFGFSGPPCFLKKHFIAFPRNAFFFEGPKVSKGKRLETVGDCTFARQKRHVFTQCSNIFHEHMLQNNFFFAERRCDLRLFPLGHLSTFKKKRRCAEMLIKKCGLDKFWPDHVSDCFRPFHFFLND